MGTNFYFVRPISQSKKDEIKQRIDKIDNIDDIYEMINDILKPQINSSTDDNIYNVHIGKRSCGWQFLFSSGIYDYWDFKSEPFNKESIIAWLSTGIVVDEYGEKYTPEQFWKECVDDCADGLIGENDIIINGLRCTNGKYFFC